MQLADFHYHLPHDRIAQTPLPQRDHARLLVWQGGQAAHRHFWELPHILPPNALLVFNDTRVIHARLYLHRPTGGQIEVLLLHPLHPAEAHTAMQAQGQAVWACMVGGKKKWPEGETLTAPTMALTAQWADRAQNHVRLQWQPEHLPMAQVLGQAGRLPLPPYIDRAPTPHDEARYQTIYAQAAGAVAAPTAGLHFTPRVLQGLRAAGVQTAFVTLHVGAGTFQPVQTPGDVRLHPMHAEELVVRRTALAALHAHTGPIVPVGTTAMRVLESLHWLGHALLNGAQAPTTLPQDYPYHHAHAHTAHRDGFRAALRALLQWLDAQGRDSLHADTRILILPGYRFAASDALITNFHLPETTLMLLVAAFIGDAWREVYAQALQQGYRFLSFGDSSLLWRSP